MNPETYVRLRDKALARLAKFPAGDDSLGQRLSTLDALIDAEREIERLTSGPKEET